MSFTGCRSLNWVTFDGGEYQVLALTGTSARLRSTDGPEMVVLAALMAAPEFVVMTPRGCSPRSIPKPSASPA